MSKRKPYKNHKSFLITERSLNYILRPVQVRKENYPYSYIIENLGKQVTVTVDRPWTYANHLILDFIGHESYKIAYQNIFKKKDTWKNEPSLNFLNSVDALKEHRQADLISELEPYADWFEKYVRIQKEKQELINKCEYSNELDRVKNQIEQLRNEIDYQLLEKFDKIFKIRNNGRGIFLMEINLRAFSKRYKAFFSKKP